MFAHLTPKERAGGACILVLFLGFAAYIGSKQIHQPAPIAIETHSAPRTSPQDVQMTPKEPRMKEAPREVVVHVIGAVKSEGVYHLSADSRVIDAITAAGGPDGADEDRLNLAGKVQDGSQIKVPKVGEVAAPVLQISPVAPISSVSSGDGGVSPDSGAPIERHAKGKSGKSPSEPVDLNSATAEELQTIPGIGPSTAGRILDYRKEHGAFQSIDELTSVGGIGQKKLEKMRPWLKI